MKMKLIDPGFINKYIQQRARCHGKKHKQQNLIFFTFNKRRINTVLVATQNITLNEERMRRRQFFVTSSFLDIIIFRRASL